MMERMILSKFEADDVAVMSPSVFRQEADLLRKEYTKVQAGRRGMTNMEKATDTEIDSYVMRQLRRIQTEGFRMPNTQKATDAEIDSYAIRQLSRIQVEDFGMPNLNRRN